MKEELLDIKKNGGLLHKFSIQTDDNLNFDGSTAITIKSQDGGIVFCSSNKSTKEFCAHTWHCPGEGRLFLKALEKYTQKKNFKLIISTVLNPRLATILKDNNYTSKVIQIDLAPFMLNEPLEIYTKD
jgi:hypothetical protein